MELHVFSMQLATVTGKCSVINVINYKLNLLNLFMVKTLAFGMYVCICIDIIYFETV